jgi:hypothetical protein
VRFTVDTSHSIRMPFVPPGAVTGIASQPLTSMTSAIRPGAESSLEIPFWPQRPRTQLESEESSILLARTWCASVALLLNKLDLVLLFDTNPAHYRHAMLVEQEERARVRFCKALHHGRNSR